MGVRELIERLFPSGPGGAARHPEWLVVGLGNPGRKYAGTRHNVGWAVIDVIAQRLDVRFKKSGGTAEVAEAELADVPFLLVRPTTYVNRSGDSVSNQIRRNNLGADRLVVIYDDLNLEPGRVRIRKKGGAGGHNGMKSVQAAIGTDEFARIRLGVGRPEDPSKQVEHVLGRMRPDEKEKIDSSVARAADAVEAILKDGIDQAMNRYNA